VVRFTFAIDPWIEVWVPPVRIGFVWVAGRWVGGHWQPGHFRPNAPPPSGYVFVPGFWYGENYVEGYYRPSERAGWRWVDGTYLDDGTYTWGTWEPLGPGPDGYVWEAGFYDGESYVDGFWRPQYRSSYRWVSAYYDADGVYHAGYWMPTEDRAGQVWVPGWFDGNEWVPGYWVAVEQFEEADPAAWTPEPGWDGGWEVGTGWGDGEVIDNRTGQPDDPSDDIAEPPEGSPFGDEPEDRPLAIPIDYEA
jgi:hypothetical protein